jgi:ribosome-associated heat shock protein Hsp15
MESGQQRLDKWLVVARFARTRSLARKVIAGGHVRLGTRRITAPDHRVRIGDVLTLALAHATLVVQVCGLSERREGSAEARTLYRELEDGIGPD